MKCIVFVNRIVTARSLSHILQSLKILSFWKCGFLVGVHSALKSMSRKSTNAILEKFRGGELNLLVATKVAEEGLDIPTCCLVIRFDLPESVSSFIQSRGRARMLQSEYAFLIDSGKQRELNLIEQFKREEAEMSKEISSRTSQSTTANFKEKIYRVDLTGATITAGSSISLLHRYCSKLPRDEYFNPKPQFFYFDDANGKVCNIILPSNAPIHQIAGDPQSSIEEAKKDACLKTCKILHECGALTDYLLPDQDDVDEEVMQGFSDSDDSDDEDLRMELHEMLVPAALKEPWSELESPVSLNLYYIKFCPKPEDRLYRRFGLLVKAALPGEAEQMKLGLHLALGRSVITEFIPSGVAKFDKDQIILAERFQQMSIKVILDRVEFSPEFVSLTKDGHSSSSTLYLLLPVILHEDDKVVVDWELIRRCLSSPIFRSPEDSGIYGICETENCLQLANGPRSIYDIVNSLVYVPCKDIFYFISDVVPEKNGYSSFKESSNHVRHYVDKFNIHLSYPDQPLLKAKRLFCLDNLLRKKGYPEPREKEEHFVELPPEICQLKIVGFSKDIGSSLSLLPSIMHRLQSLLVAIELKDKLSSLFPEAKEVTAYRLLEALTTEACNEVFSLERLEVLGDAFLKFAVGRHLFLLHDGLHEGQLTKRRSNLVNNSNLLKLAKRGNLQAYIQDWSFEPDQFFALGRPCPVNCNEETEESIHSLSVSATNGRNAKVRCSKCHHWLHKKTIADVVEALIGAFIVDSGFKAATAFLKWLGIQVDYKSLQVNSIYSASRRFLPLADQIDIAALENVLGYHFVHKGLLIQAFVHPSYNKHSGGCYQRLEFLGDAALDYLITSYLYSVYPTLKPGQLTDLRSASVNNVSFADVAIRLSFHKLILCDSRALRESITKYVSFIGLSVSPNALVEEPSCPKALGDLFESCMGAILLDTGFNLTCVWNIMLSLLDSVTSFSRLHLSPIRELKELCQYHGWDLQFPTLRNDGKFLVEARLSGKNFSAATHATNQSSKAGKRLAARLLFSHLKAQGYKLKSKSLEELLKRSKKMVPRLIGYDEVPCDCTINSSDLEASDIFKSDFDLKVLPINGVLGSCNTNVRPVPQSLFSKGSIARKDCNADSHFAGELHNGSAKSRLCEICAANCWNQPLFECCNEIGPSHLKEFTFKVMVAIEETSEEIVCYGEPRLRKKDAAEHAAEGALWYLKHQGYL